MKQVIRCKITPNIKDAIGKQLVFNNEDEISAYLIERYIEFIED